MKLVLRAFATVHAAFAAGFAALSLLLLGVAVHTSWTALAGGSFDGAVAVELIEAMGLLAVAVVSLQVEEEGREANLVFVRLNRAAEDVEPEAMQHAKQEDRKLG